MKAQRARLLALEEVTRILRAEVERAGSQAEWARKTGANVGDLSSAVTGKRPPTKAILRGLNLKKAFAYQSVSRNKVRARNKRLLRFEEVVRLLREEVAKGGGQAEWARKTGVNRANMNSTVTGKKPPTKDTLRVLGLQKVFAYEKEIKTREKGDNINQSRE
jgi:ribosomal protein L30/L7E